MHVRAVTAVLAWPTPPDTLPHHPPASPSPGRFERDNCPSYLTPAGFAALKEGGALDALRCGCCSCTDPAGRGATACQPQPTIRSFLSLPAPCFPPKSGLAASSTASSCRRCRHAPTRASSSWCAAAGGRRLSRGREEEGRGHGRHGRRSSPGAELTVMCPSVPRSAPLLSLAGPPGLAGRRRHARGGGRARRARGPRRPRHLALGRLPAAVCGPHPRRRLRRDVRAARRPRGVHGPGQHVCLLLGGGAQGEALLSPRSPRRPALLLPHSAPGGRSTPREPPFMPSTHTMRPCTTTVPHLPISSRYLLQSSATMP